MKVFRYSLTTSLAVAAQQIRLQGNAIFCIRKRLGENGYGLVTEVLEAHAHIGNIGPGISNCAELPVKNRKTTASNRKSCYEKYDGTKEGLECL